jgi:hypothetical protein
MSDLKRKIKYKIFTLGILDQTIEEG